MKQQDYKICTELQLIKRNYDTSIMIVAGLPFKQKEVIKMIEFYSNSKYMNGQSDDLGEKPFYNILNGICEVENAAKDIDTKDITATSDDGQHYTESFLMTKDIYEWMKDVNFGQTLNGMRDTHTRYGSLLVKKCVEFDEDGTRQLTIQMPEWKNVLTDQLDIEGGPIVECHYLTAGELLKKTEWDKDGINEIIDKVALSGTTKRIPVYEVRGEFPLSFIKQLEGKKVTDKDKRTFSYQLFYIAGEPVNPSQVGLRNTDTFYLSTALTPLYWEDDTERVYKYLARKKKAGRSWGVGIFEEGSEAQVWTNDIVLKQARAMDITTKVIGQSASKKLKGRNLLSETDNGTILEHEDGKPITALTLGPSGGLAQFTQLIGQWFGQLEQTTSAYAMQRGEVNTRNFRLQSLALQQSSAVFKDLQEDLGLFIVDIFEDWIMPYLTKKLNAAHILSHDFSLSELQEIDKNFSIRTANEMAINMMLSGSAVTQENYASFMQQASQMISQTKTKRFLEIPKNYYKKLKAKITINVTGEQMNKALVLEGLMNIMKIYASNPAIISDPVLTQLFMRIVELSGSGISPINLVGAFQEAAKQQAANAGKGGAKVSQSMNYKDLPPDAQQKMLEEAGIGGGAPAEGTPAEGGSPQMTRFSLSAKGGQ